MAVPTYYDNIAETTDTTGTGTLTLNDVAVSGSSVFPASVDGDTVIFGIKHSNETDWEVSEGVYTDSTKALTRTLISSSTGSLLNLSGTGHEVAIIVDAYRMNIMSRESRGHIRGVGYNRSTTTAIEIETGEIVINGTLHLIPTPFTTKTAASSSLAASSLYHIYITDDGGTIKQEWDVWASTADDPVYDAELDYKKHPSKGADFRWVGAFYTNSSAEIPAEMMAVVHGRDVTCHPIQITLFTNKSTSGTASLAGIIPSNAIEYHADLRVNSQLGSGDRGVVLRDTGSSGPLLVGERGYHDNAWGTGLTVGATHWITRYSDTIYVALDANSGADMRIRGWKVRR
jgi:hypothetical protein